jgi:hypothetical protein
VAVPPRWYRSALRLRQEIQEVAAAGRLCATLGSNVIANKVASETALHGACAALWNDCTQRLGELTEDNSVQQLDFESQRAKLREEQAKDTEAAIERLRLLERLNAPCGGSWWITSRD